MNHPRRVRLRRLLLLVPLALLGAALLVRARLPRPQTEDDKYLWQMGEQAPELRFVLDAYDDKEWKECGLQFNDILYISDRQGIRAFFRAFKDTADFTPEVPGNKTPPSEERIGYFYFPTTPEEKYHGVAQQINVYKNSQGCALLRDGIATTDCTSLVRLRHVLRDAVNYARRGDSGYQVGNIGQ